MKLITQANRKPFSKKDYDKYNDLAFQLVQKDMPDFYIYQPPENYGIDTFGYSSQEAFELGAAPLFAIELEVKRSGCWGTGEYPYPTVHFLARKAKNRAQNCIPFFVQYNQEGSNGLIIPYSHIFSYPLCQMQEAKTNDGTGVMLSNDCYYDIAKSACVFGRENLQQAIIDYYANLLDVNPTMITKLPETLMAKGNRIYTSMIGIAA